MSTRKSIQATGAPAPVERERSAGPRGQRVHTPAVPSTAPRPRAQGASTSAPPIRAMPASATASATTSHQPKRQRFGELRAALAEGWEIVQPIFARPLWSAPDDSKTAFNFVLANAQGMRLVTVPEGRTVERFIQTRQLAVDYARSHAARPY